MKTVNLYEEQKRLEEAGSQGVWVVFTEHIRFKIGSINAAPYQKVYDVAQKALRREYKGRRVPDDVAQGAMMQCLAEGVLFDWEGVCDKDGKPLPFSADNALIILKDLRRVRDFISVYAMDDDNFIRPEEEQTKN